ncbi:Flavin reductase-like protein [Caenispirillum salinarum AK4]|uniref:Flavin reductase-like protein n=1 Tax=Caenispirillum salinarum AK4 TaxID=1238182 RepID=K9H239_9PROT|nr:flavin reductase family protein [Caenispirillum salinarum]EKV31612.1 Flavin reductase-like protein [Caenispirillum salinarum AK4]
MSIDERSFRKALGCFPSGVAVVTTTDAAGRPVGVTVSSFTSLSLHPPLVLFCLDRNTRNIDAFRDGGFSVNVLREDQREVSIRFASRRDDKFEGLAVTPGTTGAPVLPDSLAVLDCVVESVAEGGDHLIFIGKVERVDYQAGGQPLVYFRGAYATVDS